jgi:hypothetical protein
MSNSTILPKYSNYPNFCGYPFYYVINGHKCECNECATNSKAEGKAVEEHVNYEDGMLYCETCSTQIEASNGAHEEVEEDSEEEEYNRSWQNEIAREAGAMYGIQAYHDHIGYDVEFDPEEGDCFACDGRGCHRCD